MDEAFYPTIAYRFLQGDRILYDEWSNTQLSALIIMPFIKLYLAFNGGTDGIYLFLRYSYTVLKLILSIFIFVCLKKKYGDGKAFFVTIVFFVFAGYGLMVISYNTIAIAGFTIFVFLLMLSLDSVSGWATRILAGVSLSISVLGIPYMAGIYLFYAFVVLFVKLTHRGHGGIRSFYSRKNLEGVTLGIAISAIIFLIYTLHHSSLGQIVQTIPQILNGDPSHSRKGIYQSTVAFIVRIIWGNQRNTYLLFVYALICLTCLCFFFDKQREAHRKIYLVAAAGLGFVLLLVYILTDNYINNVIFVPNVVALLIAIFSNDKRIKELFACIWLPGMIFTYLEYLASNTGFYGIAAASCVATIGSVMIIMIAAETYFSGVYARIPLYAFCVTTMVCCIFYRFTYVFWEDGGLPSLDTWVTHGVAAGIIATTEETEHYETLISDVSAIQRLPEDRRVLYIGDKLLWLAGTQRCASYSPLCYSITSDRSILYEYYRVHPDMIADVVFIEKEFGSELTYEIADTLGYSCSEVSSGWMLTKDKDSLHTIVDKKDYQGRECEHAGK